MRVDSLGLEDFRNYARESVELAPGLNLVVGRNAQGKTNLLEAVYCLGGLGSPRAADSGLVREGAERALLHADVTRAGRTIHLDLELRAGRGLRALVNKTPVTGVKALRELTVAVFFGPDDLALVKGPPEGRRRFLDDLVVKLRPARDGIRREWERILKQRNALLKSAPRAGEGGRSARQSLEVWDESLCRAGARLTTARLEALGELVPYARKRYESVAGGGRLDLSYDSAWLPASLAAGALDSPPGLEEESVRAALETKVAEVRDREIERGVSLVGPQRDDVAVSLVSASGDGGAMDARVYASQGDQRTSALALKLGEYDLLAEALGEEPVLLLDDVFSELDHARRGWLIETVGRSGQTLVSSAEGSSPNMPGVQKVIEVEAGRLSVRV